MSGAATALDLLDAHRVAIDAAEAAGRLLREGARSETTVRAKDGTGDVVTRLDLTTERLIIDRIRAAFPDHCIRAEEHGALDGADEARVWLVDPLDGTNNLVIGLHTYAVGIALCEDGEPVLGVVHDPVAGQTWSAMRGHGTSGPTAPGRSPAVAGCDLVVAWTQGHGVRRDDPVARSLRLVLESRARRMLQLWAPLLCWVMLARGHIDAFVGYRPEEIDLWAGVLIAREAGVAVRGLDGTAFDARIDRPELERSFVAARAEIIDEVLLWLGHAEAVRPDLARLLVAPRPAEGSS